jgi:hypothetical protein
MDYIPTILVDDDDAVIRTNFRLTNKKHNVKIETFESWDKTKEYIESGQPVDALVLDAKGKITTNRAEENSHIMVALQYMAIKNIPYAIFTAYREQIDSLNYEFELGKVFDKGGMHRKTEGDVIEYLKGEIEKTPKVRLIQKYATAYQVYNRKIISYKYEHIFIDMVKCLENEDYSKKNLNVIRDLLESLFLSLIENFEFIPQTFINQKGSPNLEWCTRFFEGRPTKDAGGKEFILELEIPTHISALIRYIKEITSEYSHFNENAVAKTSFICASYSTLEVLEWLPKFIDDNFEY